jgi:hypothetical protein
VKNLRGIPGDMFCENQRMLAHGMLKERERERRTLHSFVMVMSIFFYLHKRKYGGAIEWPYLIAPIRTLDYDLRGKSLQ